VIEALYGQYLRSGIAKGAVTGAVTAGEVGISAGSPLAFAGYGAIIGAGRDASRIGGRKCDPEPEAMGGTLPGPSDWAPFR